MKYVLGSLFALAVVVAGAVEPATAAAMPAMSAENWPLWGLAGLIVNQANLQIIYQAFKTAFNAGFRSAQPMWEKVATLVPSTTGEEKYGWLGQFPRLREWVGDRQIKNMAAHDYAIKNNDYEGTVGVPRNNIDDDSYGVFTPLMQEMGYAAATHPDELVFELLQGGFATECYDGQYFFDTDHPVGNEETGVTSVSNMQSGAGNPWFLLDTSRPLKPLLFQRRKDYNFVTLDRETDENVFMRKEFLYGVDGRGNVGYGFWQQAFGSKDTLDKTNFDAATEAMMGFKSDEGRPLGVKPTTLVCGPSNRAAAMELIEVQKLSSGADNPNYKAVEVLVVGWLD